MSKKITLNADNTTKVEDGKLADIITTVFDSDVALTGLYKYGQIALGVFGGMVYANKRHTDSFMNFGNH